MHQEIHLEAHQIQRLTLLNNIMTSRLLFYNFLSFAISIGALINFKLLFHSFSPTVPEAFIYASKNMSKDQVVDTLIKADMAINSINNAASMFLYAWIGLGFLNLIILIRSLIKNKATNAPVK